MRIAFFFSLQDVFSVKKPLQYQEEMAFGISYISAVLKEHGHETALYILVRETNEQDVRLFIDTFNPSVVCFTAVATEFLFISKWAKKIKEKYPSVYSVCGGCHVSLNPESATRETFDAICIGEGEYPLLECVEQLAQGHKPSGIMNMWFQHNATIERNPTRTFIEDIDKFPFPDREMWVPWLLNQNSRPALLLGRGCPFKCTYCSNHALSQISAGRYVRVRSPENILEELGKIVTAQRSVTEVYFEIETFGIDIPWALTLCAALMKFNKDHTPKLSFGVNLRITPHIDYESLFDAMARANFKFVNIGLESGSERVRKEIMKRSYANSDIEYAVEIARKYGLQVHFLNMVGLPTETEEDIKQTIACNRKCQPDLWASHSIFFPYPGTNLYDFCVQKGYLPDVIDMARERTHSILTMETVSRKKIKHYYEWFDYYVYRGFRPLSIILIRVFLSKIHSSYSLMKIYRRISEFGFLKRVKRFLKSQ